MKFLPCEHKMNLSVLITGEKRETPIRIESLPFQQTDRIRFVLPEGYIVKSLPEDYLSVSAFGIYSLVFINRDREIEVLRTVNVSSLEVDEEDYPLLVDFCKGVDRAEERKIELEK